MNKLLVRLRNWEYWPFSVFYLPVFFYFGWLALKHRSLFFFSSSNPSIEFGGMFGEKKSEIFDLIPAQYIPKTKWIAAGDLESAMEIGKKMGFPLIAKPDIGERGIGVEKIDDIEELEAYVSKCPVHFLIQELIEYPLELGVFYVRLPNEKHGRVTSIVRKKFLTVQGDGKSSILELLKSIPRALLTANMESHFLTKHGADIPKKEEVVLIEPIGNHSRGTQFLNDAAFIDAELSRAIDRVAKEIPGFYFGRFDLKCKSYEDLKQLKHFKILELNGAGAEPGHIYEPGFSLIQAYTDIFWHLSVLADISSQNKKRGVPFWSFQRGYAKWRAHQRYNRLLSNR